MKCFETDRKESFYTKLYRLLFRIFPAYYCSGGKVRFIAADWHEVHVSLNKNFRTRNYVGTVFGGSSFGALDPVYMIQLIKILGPQYVVWDKAASVKFIRPVKRRVCAKFQIDNDLIADIKNNISGHKEITIMLPVCLEDSSGLKYVEVEKTLYIADKEYYKQKRSKR